MGFVHKTIAEITALSDAGKDNYAKEKREHEADQVKEQIENATKTLVTDNEALKTKLEKSLEGSVKLAGDVDTLVTKVKTLEAGRADQGGKNIFKQSFESVKGSLTDLANKKTNHVDFVIKADVGYADLTVDGQLDQLRPGISDIVKKRVYLYDLFRKTPMVTETYTYLEQTSAVRDAQGVALCAKGFTSLTKEEIGKESVKYVEIKDTANICRAYADDYNFVENRYRTLLSDSMAFKIENELLLGTDATTSTNSINAVSSEFAFNNVAAPIGASIDDANYVDLLLSMATQIDVLGKLGSFMANVALVNKMDWFKLVESKKDANGNYLDYRVRSVNGSIVIGNLTILPLVDVPANTVYVMDTTKGEILNRKSVELTMSTENGTNFVDGFVTMMMIARLQFLVENNNINAFMKCTDVSTAITAITKI